MTKETVHIALIDYSYSELSVCSVKDLEILNLFSRRFRRVLRLPIHIAATHRRSCMQLLGLTLSIGQCHTARFGRARTGCTGRAGSSSHRLLWITRGGLIPKAAATTDGGGGGRYCVCGR